tara:strand:+ start:314 stop:2374 length:2061 start_codon:yes stop_codon:yes gene_type:complete
MFADLKEYQDLTRIYNESVNISEEERELQKFIDEEDFTLEELEFCVENFEEICSLEFNEDYLVESNLNEEDLHEILGGIFRGIGKALGRKAVVTMGKGGAGKIAKTAAKVTKGKGAKVLSKGAELKKRMAAAYDKNILGKGGSNLLTKAGTKVKNVTTKIGKTNLGKKLTGAGKNIAKTVKKNPAKLLVPGAIVGSGVAGFIAGGAGKKGSKGVAAPTNKLSDAELDAKIKAGIAATGMGDKGTAITQKGREQAAYNRGERAARKKLNDPTLNLTKSELEAKAAKEKEKAAADAKSKQKEKPMSKIEFQNRKRFGDEHVDNLKNKNVDFQKMKKGEMTKKEFIDKYPKSQTAKKYYNSPKAYRDYKKSLKKEDYSFAQAYTNMYKQENINEMGAAALIPKDSFSGGKAAPSKKDAPTKPAAGPSRKPSKMGAASLIPDSSFSDTSVRRRSSARGGAQVKEETVEEGIGGIVGGALKKLGTKAAKVTKLGQKAAVGFGGIGVGVGGGKMLDDARKEGKKGKKKPAGPKPDYSKPLEYGVGPGKALIHYAPTKPKKSMKEEMDYLGYDAYDVVLEYLLQTEQVSSIEEANYVMTEMEGTTINEILNEMVPILGGIVKAGKTMGKVMSKVSPKKAAAVGAGVGAAGAAIGKKIKQSGKKAGEAMKGAAKAGSGLAGAVGGQASRKMRGE